MKKILIILALFTSCKSTGVVEVQTQEADDVNVQLSKSWSIVSIGGTQLKSHKFAKKAPELSLDLDKKKLSGFGGCNTLAGTVDLNDTHLDFGAISSSRMICPDIEIEQRLLKLLSNQSYQYKMSDGHLILTGASGDEIIMKNN